MLAVVVVTAAIELVDNFIPVLSLGVLYIFAVLPVALFWGTLVAVPVAVASMLAFNFFFLPPLYSFTLADRQNWSALAVYIVTAVVVGGLASRYRTRGAEAEQREREAALLSDIAVELLRGTHLDQELDRIAERTAAVLGVSSVRIALGERARSGSHDSPHLLVVDGRPIGTLFTPESEEPALATCRRLLPALASLLAVARERETLAREALDADTLRRSDTVKTAVIQAVSHDLRTPLATIEQALDGLESGELALTDDDRAALLETIRVEHSRLKRLVENLLDLSRLQVQAAEARPELWTADELVSGALDELGDDSHVNVTAPAEATAGSHRRDPDPARSRQPDRERTSCLATGRAGPRPSDGHAEGAAHPRDRSRPGSPRGRTRAHLPTLLPRRRPTRRARRRSRVGHRARVHRGQRGSVVARDSRGPGGLVRPGAATRGAARRGPGVSGERVLVVDDEPQFLRALQTNLRGAGYDVVAATTAEEALSAAALRPPDAVILDLLLPDGRGTDVCRELRRWTDAPIILVSAVGDEVEKISALDAGADDYVTKPFAIGELLARLRAALRRAGPATEPTLVIGALSIDLEKHSVSMDGEAIHLTPHEFELLRVLAQNEGKLLTHKTILREVWGPAYQQESSYLHVFVSQLRRKLEPDPARPRYILTEPGAGYRLVNPAAHP